MPWQQGPRNFGPRQKPRSQDVGCSNKLSPRNIAFGQQLDHGDIEQQQHRLKDGVVLWHPRPQAIECSGNTGPEMVKCSGYSGKVAMQNIELSPSLGQVDSVNSVWAAFSIGLSIDKDCRGPQWWRLQVLCQWGPLAHLCPMGKISLWGVSS